MSGRSICALDDSAADRLAKLCGMFGSNHDGERASAAALADKLVRQLGLTWREIIVPANDPEPEHKAAPQWDDPITIEQALKVAQRYQVALTEWECGFVRDLRRKRTWRLSEKQNDVLNDIVEKCRLYAMQEAA
jgi:hypothetical protein